MKKNYYCDNCGAKVGFDDEICPECGLKFVKTQKLNKENELIYYCNNCGAEVSYDEEFCPKCGLEFDEELDENTLEDDTVYYCSKCGSQVSYDDVFCPKCGLNFNTTEQKSTNGFCVASLVLGIISIFLFNIYIIPLLAVIFGIVGISTVDKNNQSGKGMGIAGLILGILYLMEFIYYFIQFYSK